MRNFHALLALLLLLGWSMAAGQLAAAEPSSAADEVSELTPASLPAPDGELVPLFDSSEAKVTVVCFLGTECPLAKVYGPRLNDMAERFAGHGIRFIGVNSNRQDSMEELREYQTQHGIEFPVVKDFDQSVAIDFGATRTPEVFVVTAAGRILYRGRIDDQYQPGVSRSEAKVDDLQTAIEQILDGRPVSQPVTDAVGCLIGFPDEGAPGADSDITYCDQVSRILQRHCVECHRPGEIGPFALTDYDELVGWADMVLEVIEEGRMPPWHARDAAHDLANVRGMSAEEKAVLREWVDAGTPYGDPAELPPPIEVVTDWTLPSPPDVVLPMGEEPFVVPATGVVEYQYYVVDPGFENDRWVQAAEVRPGNRSVVHHCIAFIRPPDGADVGRFGILAAYVPGQQPTVLPSGYARRIPAGSKIVFQMHYTPVGTVARDVTEVGLIFAEPEGLTHEVDSIGGIRQEFEIPPGAPDHRVTGEVKRYPRGGELLSVMPHMHLRGKSFRLFAEREGHRETWLDVPAYDFNWQHNYAYLQPPSLDDVERLSFEARFDNSAGNPFNPDPSATVTWGDQTWEEMAVVFLDVAEPLDAPEPAASADPAVDRPAVQARSDAELERRRELAGAFADRYFRKFDRNGDGVIERSEVPDAVRLFAFSRFDHNHSGVLEREDLILEALSRDLGL